MRAELKLENSEKLNSLFEQAKKLINDLELVNSKINLILGTPNIQITEHSECSSRK